MATAAELTILIQAQNNTTQVLRQIRGDLEATEKRATSFGAALQRIGERASGFILANVAQRGFGILESGFKDAIKAASDFDESLSKTRVVFGDASADVEAFARGSARSLGISRQSALEATATFGNLFTAMRIGQQPAAEMSKAIVQLASDLASFNNTNPEDALQALRSGLVGEIEPLRRYGVNLNAAAIEQRALSLGLIETKDQLTPATRAQAAYSIILEQTATAQGDFARTSTGLANSQRSLKGIFEDLSASLGKALIPTATFAVQSLAEIGNGFDTSNTERAFLRIQISIVKVLEQLESAVPGIQSFGDKVADILNSTQDKARDVNRFLNQVTFGAVPLGPNKPQANEFPDRPPSSGLIYGPAFPSPQTGLAGLRATLEAQLANVGKDVDKLGGSVRGAVPPIDTFTSKLTTASDVIGGVFSGLSALTSQIFRPTREQAQLQLQVDQEQRAANQRRVGIDAEIANLEFKRAQRLSDPASVAFYDRQIEAQRQLLTTNDQYVKKVQTQIQDLDLAHKIEQDKVALGDKTLLSEQDFYKWTGLAATATETLTGRVNTLGDAIGVPGGLITQVLNLNKSAQELDGVLKTLAQTGSLPGVTTDEGGVPVPAKAAGGPVSAGRSYLVGERGPELLVPKEDGFVVPNKKLKDFRAALAADGENIQINNFAQSAKVVIPDLMSSPPHKANILDKDYRYTGVGSAESPKVRGLNYYALIYSDQLRGSDLPSLSGPEQSIFIDQNKERTQAHLPPLRIDTVLESVAHSRAMEMATTGRFSHFKEGGKVGPKGLMDSQGRSTESGEALQWLEQFDSSHMKVSGGPVLSGEHYLVGESGPEMMFPNNYMHGMGGSSVTNHHNNQRRTTIFGNVHVHINGKGSGGEALDTAFLRI